MRAEFKFSTTIEGVWKCVGNTERTNRALGFGSVQYSAVDEQDGRLTRVASTRILGVKAVWREFPFEWQKPYYLSVRREYSRGIFKLLTMRMDLHPEGEGTRLEINVSVNPRFFFLYPLCRLAEKAYVDGLNAYVVRSLKAESSLASFADAATPPPKGLVSPSNVSAVEEGFLRLNSSLKQARADAVSLRLRQHVVEGEDLDLLNMRPLALIRRWEMDERTSLPVFFEGVKAGLFDAKWSLICPTCRIPKQQVQNLSDVGTQMHCEFCGIDYENDLGENVELQFDVSPRVRAIDREIYCIGGPQQGRHLRAQVILEPGHPTLLKIDRWTHKLVVRSLKTNIRQTLAKEQVSVLDSRGICLGFGGTSWEPYDASISPDNNDGSTLLRPGFLTLVNQTTRPTVVVLEEVDPDPTALTALKIMLFDDLKRVFDIGSIAPGRSVTVKRIAIMFTDLVGSTAMYETVGDGPAFAGVQRHFDFLEGHCRDNSGVIVKSIGDAIMASFPTAAHAMRAALAIQRNLPEFNRVSQLAAPIRLRIGIHEGPAIVVEANGRLDYFGRSINIASRVEHEGEADAVVVSDEVAESPELQQTIASLGSIVGRKSVKLKGIAGSVGLQIVKPQGTMAVAAEGNTKESAAA